MRNRNTNSFFDKIERHFKFQTMYILKYNESERRIQKDSKKKCPGLQIVDKTNSTQFPVLAYTEEQNQKSLVWNKHS